MRSRSAQSKRCGTAGPVFSGVPSSRGPDASPIEVALVALAAALTEVGAPWMVIGGIAVIAHGVQRMTTDIDAVIQGDAVSVPQLLAVLSRHHIVSRIDDAAAFASTNLVVLARHAPTEVDLDLSLGWTAFEREALAARASTAYGTVTAPMAGVEEYSYGTLASIHAMRVGIHDFRVVRASCQSPMGPPNPPNPPPCCPPPSSSSAPQRSWL
jgi:hypothetical protein